MKVVEWVDLSPISRKFLKSSKITQNIRNSVKDYTLGGLNCRNDPAPESVRAL